MATKLRCTAATSILSIAALLVSFIVQPSAARPPIRKAFFSVYPNAVGTQLDDLPSNSGHCGVCHYDFNGGGPRNPYGLAIQVAIESGLYSTYEEDILSVENLDSDGDGYTNLTEITSTLFTNTPTFPGLTASDSASVLNIPWSEVAPYVTPLGSSDTTPPTVTVLSPNGTESFNAATTQTVTWSATDASGIDIVDIYLSDDNGATFEPIAVNEPNDGSFSWLVTNLPGSQNIIRVRARDNAGNWGSDWSDAPFTIIARPPGVVPTTMRDMKLPGSEPFQAGVFDDPDVTCVTCHGNYDSSVEPWFNWKGSMMAQAVRDPIWAACVTIAEQDAPSVGDLCIRCHSPGGWLEGHSADTGGGMLNAKDRQGVQCDFCHRLVDPNYQEGISPTQDVAVIDSLTTGPPSHHANGQFVVDPTPIKRGPYSDAKAAHAFLQSPFHLSGDLCGTCHDVSNPVFNHDSTVVYEPNAFDTAHPDGDVRNMFPIERTYSEWSASEYASTGVYAPQFAGNKPDGIVSTCEDCHMHDVTGNGCNVAGSPNRTDLGLHDLTGGNTFAPDMIAYLYPSEVDTVRLNAGKARAVAMLQKAASMALEAGQDGPNPTVTVAITNETGHKLPSGYPEGRHIWLNVKAYDADDNQVYESGAYNPATGVLTRDADIKVYETEPGISTRLAAALGATAGPSFHFVLNDTVYKDNRIPPRGFTNAGFLAVQSPPVAYSYADSVYWDNTEYSLPTTARFVDVTLYYQGTSKEYIEFLRDENVTNNRGQDVYNAWAATGRAAPVVMQHDTISVQVVPTGIGDTPHAVTAMWQNYPNPFNPSTTVRYSLRTREHVRIAVYDVTGALVRVLVDEVHPAGVQKVEWRGNDLNDSHVASGVYFIKMTTATRSFVKKAVILK